MILVTLADGSERLFIPRHELAGVLDLDQDSKTYAEAKRLLIERGLLTPWRRNSSPARGFLLPPEWRHEHAGHLRKHAARMLREHPVEAPTVGRIHEIW
jgi:hypothetical protein